jgi:hypothetical protein
MKRPRFKGLLSTLPIASMSKTTNRNPNDGISPIGACCSSAILFSGRGLTEVDSSD